MSPHDIIKLTRRDFLTSTASGLGLLALASMFRESGLLAADAQPTNPFAPSAPHFAPKAKACIFIFMEGAPSQMDLFDPKPRLNELDGEKLPDSLTNNVRFAFIRKESAVLMGREALALFCVDEEEVDRVEEEYRRRDRERLDIQASSGDLHALKEQMFSPANPLADRDSG